MDSSSGKDLWPYEHDERGWPLLRVATKGGTTVLCNTTCTMYQEPDIYSVCLNYGMIRLVTTCVK